MKNQKRTLVMTTTLRRAAWAAAIGALCGIGVELLVYLIGLIVSHNLTSFLVSLQVVPGSLATILSWVLVGYFLITPYSDFKWAIQNGISRKILWQGRFLALVCLTLIVWLYGQLVHFGNFSTAWRSLLATFALVLTVTAIGNGFALLNRRWKWIVGIGGPVACGVILTMVGYSFVGLIPVLSASQLLRSLLTSPITWWTLLVIYLLVMWGLAKYFNSKLQLRRD